MPPSELPHETLSELEDALDKLKSLAIKRQETLDSLPTIADPNPLEASATHLPRQVPDQGWGLRKAVDFLLENVAPTLNPGHAGPRYFGFITGGVLPSALVSDWFTTLYDQNVQVHLPNETASTVIEAYTMQMLAKLLDLDAEQYTGTLTTGATSSNLLALICAREETMKRCMSRKAGHDNWSVAEHGLAGSDMPIKVFVSQAHASIKKAAALAGIGRANVIDVGRRAGCTGLDERDDSSAAHGRMECLDFDLQRLDAELRHCQQINQPAIVVVSMGEVVTGALSDQTVAIRKMCDSYDAWLHMDAGEQRRTMSKVLDRIAYRRDLLQAFSAFVCLLEGYHWVSLHMSVCDSITSDGHKALNVPYDCGILLVRKDRALHTSNLEEVCGPGSGGGPSYLASSRDNDEKEDAIIRYIQAFPSPLNRNLENSRRFRALPLYISLLSQGRQGTASMIQRNVDFAARIRNWIEACPFYHVLTPICPPLDTNQLHSPQPWKGAWNTTVVFFRAHPVNCPIESFKGKSGHLSLVHAIKQTRQVYVSPGSLGEFGGVRIAVSNWSTGLNGDNDFEITTTALLQVMQSTAER